MPWPTHIVAVAGLVEDGKGNVLMAKRADRGTWEFCGGGQVELGENLEQALIREIREEGGVDVSMRCLAGVYSNIQQVTWRDGVTPVLRLRLANLLNFAGQIHYHAYSSQPFCQHFSRLL